MLNARMRQGTLGKFITGKLNLAPMVPDDHGAYAMLLVPFGIGVALGLMRGVSAETNPVETLFLLALALLAAFFSHAPLEVIARPNVNEVARHRAQAWLAIYGGILVAGGLGLVAIWKLWDLLWLVPPAAIPPVLDYVARRYRKQRSLPVRLVGIAGLVLSAPAAYYVTTGQLDTLALALWAINLVYFGSTLFFVRLWFEAKKLEKHHQAGQSLIPPWLMLVTLLFHVAGALVIAGLVLSSIVPWTVALAFAPLAAKMATALLRPPTNISIKRVGLFEFAQSFVFALVLVLSLR